MAKKFLFSKIFPKDAPGLQQTEELARSRKPKPAQLKFVFFIVNWKQTNIVTDILKEEKVRFFYVAKGMGTAASDILDLLGIGAEDKAVISCLEQAVMVHVLMKEVMQKLNLANPGTGIAFSMPLSALNNPLLLVFKQSIYENEKLSAALTKAATTLNDPAAASHGKKRGTMANIHSHDLILGIVNHGFSDEFMNTARAAGATGGTVLQARGQAHEGPVKYFGISVQEEKEIILVLTSCEKKVEIMRAVSEQHGLNSQAQGIILSLPVDEVMGIQSD